MTIHSKLLLLLTFQIIITGCSQEKHGSFTHIKKVTLAVDDNRLINADKSPGDWLSYGRNYAEDRYSELEQINKENIKDLGLAWSLSIGTTRNGIERTPVVVDGIMDFTGPWSKVYAANAATGEMIWQYDPELNLLYIGTGNGSPWNRIHRSPGGGDNLFLSSIIALNPDDGKMAWYYQTTPGDSWDYTATQHLILTDLMVKGKGCSKKNKIIHSVCKHESRILKTQPRQRLNLA